MAMNPIYSKILSAQNYGGNPLGNPKQESETSWLANGFSGSWGCESYLDLRIPNSQCSPCRSSHRGFPHTFPHRSVPQSSPSRPRGDSKWPGNSPDDQRYSRMEWKYLEDPIFTLGDSGGNHGKAHFERPKKAKGKDSDWAFRHWIATDSDYVLDDGNEKLSLSAVNQVESEKKSLENTKRNLGNYLLSVDCTPYPTKNEVTFKIVVVGDIGVGE